MKLKRIAPGDYLSADGRVRIRFFDPVFVSDGFTGWIPTVDGVSLPRQRTKQSAVAAAERELARRDGRGQE